MKLRPTMNCIKHGPHGAIRSSSDSLAEIIKSFAMFYGTKEGYQICISQDDNAVVCVQD